VSAITTSAVRSRLQPYLPRLTLEWLAEDPDRLHRRVDASVVFVDISGFTALSEKLAKLGRVGAEEMAEAINGCFTELLVLAYEQGGSLLKFGGDALLLLFPDGEPKDHAARAARAAVGMRKRLRQVGRIQTPGGRVNLRMSVGLHAGPFDLFLVGDSHRELVVTGPAATEVVTMEGTAEAGEIVMSPMAASLLPAAARGEPKGDGIFLRSAPKGETLETIAVLPEVPDDLLMRSVPVATRDSLLAGVTDPEHRQVAVGFIHFDGTDALIEREGPAVVAGELDRLVRDTQAAVDELGVCFLGSDVDADGGKLIVCAGAPRAVGEDEERLLLALRRIVEPERPIGVRVGVNQGPVFAGDIGPHYRRTYTVMGDTVNLAARLMAKAGEREVFASGSVLERSATRFETTELEPFFVKGKAKPVQAWAVGPPIGRPKHAAAEEHPLRGRDDELAMLHAAMNDARAGRVRAVMLRGEAGIGKTRLLDEVLTGCADFRLSHATSETFTAMTPYFAWRGVLRELAELGWEDPSEAVVERFRSLLETTDPSLLPWLPLIASAADADMEATDEVRDLADEFRRARMHEAVVGFLRAIRPEPTLFVFEDAHVMDEASADLLRALASDARGDRPWLILVLARPADGGFQPGDGGVEVADILPLDANATRSLVQTVTDEDPLPGHVIDQLVERSQGNPQLALDLVHTARTGGGSLPESVEAAATVRIDSLTPHDRQLVRRVSVFGMLFHPRFVNEVIDETAAPDDATWARLAEFFEPADSGYLRFRRAVIRDAAYAGLPFRTRRRLHLNVGLRWEREVPDPDENGGLLSLHLSLGGEYDKAWRYACIAGERAAGMFANIEAAQLYERAIDAGKRCGAEREELRSAYEELGRMQTLTGVYVQAKRSFAEAHRLADDPVTRARMMLRRAYIEEYVGSYPRALGWLTRARRVLEEAPGDDARVTEVEIAYRRCAIYYNEGRAAEAASLARDVIARAEAIGADDVAGNAHNVLGNALSWLGEAGAEDELRAALANYERRELLPGQAMALLNLGAYAYWDGRWSDAADLYRQARDLNVRTANPIEAAFAAVNIAEIYLEQGRIDEAEPLLRDASRELRSSGELQGLAASLGFLGRVEARLGGLEDAEELLRQARGAYEQAGMKAGMFEIDAHDAERLAMAGRAEEALTLADATLAHMSEDVGVEVLAPMLERTRGYAYMQLGKEVDAGAAFSRSLELARAREAPHEVALTLLGLVRIDREGHAVTGDPRFLEMREIFGALGVIATPAYPMHEAPPEGRGLVGSSGSPS
jgi:class 3 adenylate cyclase/tetratricopeptide (TPR) repeat protein